MMKTWIILFTFLLCTQTVNAHLQEDTMKCFNLKTAKKVSEAIIDSNGMLLERYDTNGDGKPDFATLSHVLGTDDKKIQHDKRPVFFLTKDAEKVYIDKVGDGQCKSIVLYHDESIPHDKGMMTRWQRMPMDDGKNI